MRQIWISKAGEPEVLQFQEAPNPTPRIGEVRIKVQACGINFADVIGRMGMYADAPHLPFVPGYEVTGIIDMVGQGVPNLREGEPVFALTKFGGYSDLICITHKQVFKRLEWMPPTDAVALPINYLIAYQMLMVMGSLRPQNKVLIHGVGGGVGLAALDICRIVGAETYGTASPQKHEFLLSRGLQYPIDYRNHDYERVINDLTGGHGVHLILDPFGGIHWLKNYRLLMPTGRLVHFGLQNMVKGKRRSWSNILRAMVMIPFYSPIKLMNDNKGVMGVNLGHLWELPQQARQWMNQITSWYDEALFRPHIDRTFPFEQVIDAHHYLHDRKNVGKVVLTLE
jgi:synaptic vesicle membrane protein VAT-1